MQRTVQLPLIVSPAQAALLTETSRQFTEAFNAVCQTGWEADESNSVRLHHLSYRSLKDRLPDLVSDLHIQARVKAAEALTSAFTRRKDGRKTSCPCSVACPPRYNLHTFKINWQAETVSLSTVEGRIVLPFVLPEVFAWAALGKVCTADLIQRNGRFFLHVSIQTEAPAVEPSPVVVGVDLGINRPAVTSERSFLGKRQWKEVENRIFRQKRQCQAKRTKSGKRRLKILRGKQARFRRDCDHILSRRIVDETPPGGTIVLEDLTNIRDRMKGCGAKQRRRLHSWSFVQLKTFIGYKAEMKGVRVILIDPAYTSQTCSKCGHKHRSNRKTQSLFCCRSCGYTLNADLNASYNIRDSHLGVFGMSLDARPSSTGPTSLTVQCGGVARRHSQAAS